MKLVKLQVYEITWSTHDSDSPRDRDTFLIAAEDIVQAMHLGREHLRDLPISRALAARAGGNTTAIHGIDRLPGDVYVDLDAEN